MRGQLQARLPWTLILCLLVGLAWGRSAHAVAPDAVGGGSTDGGLEGAYYANPDLEGEPSFVRRDVRIDYVWTGGQPVGGSTAPSYHDFPSGGFSVRWVGQLLPRFSEAYTFLGSVRDGIRLRLRAVGDSEWTVLIDHWNQAGAFRSPPTALVSGRLYDIEVEYRAAGGDAACSLRWESPSTPAEVIDPVVQHGLNATSWQAYIWADLVRSARYGDDTHVDGSGWPSKGGVELVGSEMNAEEPELAGTYLLTFEGRSEVEQHCCNQVIFEADGSRLERTLPKGVGYDSASNVTSALMHVDGSRFMLHFNDAQRRPRERDNGVTQIRLMRPLHSGSDQHHLPGDVVYRPFKRTIPKYFTTLRWLSGANSDLSGHWSDRSKPDHAFFATDSGEENWEYLVMLANETGRDLYITTPVAADDEYFHKLALLLRYGSDGNEPYRQPTENPVYPPLNPNLRAYVEVGNEIWNWAFPSTQVAQRLAKAEADANSDTWKAIDFDGQAGEPEHAGGIRRWHALRTIACSQAFREVFGDEQMGARVRIVLEYQYDNYQDTAILSLGFLDRYLGYRASERGEEAHPISYYLWGAGGATYYGLRNKNGEQTDAVLSDHSFEKPSLRAGTSRARPGGTAWTFKGPSGVIHPGEAEEVDGLTYLPKPASGKQAGFIRSGGEIQQAARFTKPGRYAIAFSAAGSGENWPGHLPFDIYVDDEKVSPRGQTDTRVSDRDAVLTGWGRDISNLEERWGSAVFEVDAPGVRNIRFIGRDEPDDYLLIDDVSITSVDAIMSSGFDSGEALGQVGDSNLAQQFRGQASYARTFGLQVMAYEAGWSLGGDFHQLPIQTWAKFYDPRATRINDRMMELWDESGSFMNVWGVFTYWPSWDSENIGKYAIMKSLQRSVRALRTDASYGVVLPADLAADEADLSESGRVHAGGAPWWARWLRWLPWSPPVGGTKRVWRSWMVVAPETSDYTIQADGSGEGTVVIELDGEEIGRFGSLGAAPGAVSVNIPKGAHAFRVITYGDASVSALRVKTTPPIR